MNEQETSADIIAEMLGARTEFPFVYLMGEPDTPEVIDFTTQEIIAPRKINIRRVTVKELASRLKAALKRESGDRAKMREALSDACYAMFNFLRAQNGGYEEMADALDKAKASLAAPPRNCDVGDADDWEKRFGEECDNSHTCSVCPVRHAKTKMAIEFNKGARCEFIWAQMPYEEGGANE